MASLYCVAVLRQRKPRLSHGPRDTRGDIQFPLALSVLRRLILFTPIVYKWCRSTSGINSCRSPSFNDTSTGGSPALSQNCTYTSPWAAARSR